MHYEYLSGKALKCMYTAGAAAAAAVSAVLGALNYFFFFPEDVSIGKYLSLVLLILTFLDLLISPYFRYRRYRYCITEECIDIREGYLFIKRHIVPIERLHKLKMTKGPIDQMFQVANVVVTTAGGDVTIRFLEEEKAEQIADSLRTRINQIAIKQRENYDRTH